uniref:hypothetical protein n=1 Tax=Ruminococcus bromii TaxID=40518 RepID=UPI00266D91F1
IGQMMEKVVLAPQRPRKTAPYRYLTVMIVYPIRVFVNRLITEKTNKKYSQDNVDIVITL